VYPQYLPKSLHCKDYQPCASSGPERMQQRALQKLDLLNHLVGAREQRRRHG